MEKIGQITLNVSFVLYLCYLFPQLIHNVKAGQIKKLSLLMHSILLLAYIADLVYGFGREMEWQYITVSVVGLVCLLIQHFQILFNYEFEDNERSYFNILTVVLYLLIFISSYLIFSNLLNKQFLIGLGFISQIGWFSYALPQIYKNYKLKSADGLSIYFIVFLLIIIVCDTISAWTLNWDLPNKIGAPISFFIKLTLLLQFLIYRKQNIKESLKKLNLSG